jgi:adenylyltransferase/sulfurtransferase
VTPRAGTKLDFAQLAVNLKPSGTVTANKFLLKAALVDAGEAYEFTLFPDGRAIIKGTDDVDRAKVLYAKYVGH